MTWEIALVFVVLAGVMLAFVREWAPPEVVAFSAASVALLAGLVPFDDALEAFSNPAPITVACMFVISAGLERTGCIEVLGGFFNRAAKGGELRVLLVLMLLAGGVSAFVNNTPVVVVFLPIVMSLARSTGIPASKLLIPLSFAAILGGTCALTGTSTNLVVDGLASSEYGQRRLGMFEMTPLGIVYALIGIAYMMTIGRRLLPRRETFDAEIEPRDRRDFLTQVEVEEESPLVGRTLVETLLTEFPEAKILEVRRRGAVLTLPLDELEIRGGDRILLTVHGTSFEEFKKTGGLRFPSQKHLRLKQLETRELKLMEGMIGPQSSLAGQTLKDLRFRQRYGVLILAVHRKGEELTRDFGNIRLQFGDTLLVEGPVQAINRLQNDLDFIALTAPPKTAFRRSRAWPAVLIVGAFVLSASLTDHPIAGLALLAAVAMLLAGCVQPAGAYRSIQWSIVLLIVGMLILGMAMEQTGAAAWIAEQFMGLLDGHAEGSWLAEHRSHIALSLTYLMAWILTEFVSNNAVAAVVTPIAIGIAMQLGVDVRPFLIAVVFGCSASFATPIGYQTNTYVYGAGGYRFRDFLRVGLPLNAILWVAASLLIPVFWPFGE